MAIPVYREQIKKIAEKPRTRLGNLSLEEILVKHIDRILHCFTWVNNYNNAQDYEQAVQVLESSIYAIEAFLSPNLDKKFWKTKMKILNTKPEPFEEIYNEKLNNMDRDDPYVQREISNMEAIHILKNKVLQLNILFRELMRWIDQSELGFDEVSDSVVEYE